MFLGGRLWVYTHVTMCWKACWLFLAAFAAAFAPDSQSVGGADWAHKQPKNASEWAKLDTGSSRLCKPFTSIARWVLVAQDLALSLFASCPDMFEVFAHFIAQVAFT